MRDIDKQLERLEKIAELLKELNNKFDKIVKILTPTETEITETKGK